MFGLPTTHSTGMPVLDARDDFARARRAQLAARWLRGRRRPAHPPTLPPDACPAGAARLEIIPLCSIVGTVEPSPWFDARFRPASERMRARWERVALAHRRGLSLPPIAVKQGPDGYYVVDGRHRVSVALATGRREIDAWGGMTGSAALPPDVRALFDGPNYARAWMHAFG
jgi:hypothetical protein